MKDMTTNGAPSKSAPASPGIDISTMRLGPKHFRILATGSMEQIIGAGLSALVGIIIPILQLISRPELSSLMQGLLGAMGLTGIAVGSFVFGKLTDRYGYLFYFRLCPVLIMAGSLAPFIWPHTGVLIPGLFVAGLGVGGGYTLDEDYISELMPTRYRLLMVGIAKATSSLGFIAIAGLSYWIIMSGLHPREWNYLLLLLAGLGLITLLGRIRFRNSPRWLLAHGHIREAEAAARFFLGPDAVVRPVSAPGLTASDSGAAAKEGAPMWKKIVFSGVPWAMEGIGVYGVGVFLPLLVLALGLDHSDTEGMAKVADSVLLTTVINCFILVGFAAGLAIVRRTYHVSMLGNGFIGAAAGLLLLLLAYIFGWPVWISILSFVVFETFLNGGPHLITFIIPSQIYSVKERGTGTGTAAMLGKLGAILGVFLMPVLLRGGGIKLVLAVCIGVNLIGAAITYWLGPQVLPRKGR